MGLHSINDLREMVEEELLNYLPEEETLSKSVRDAMAYSLTAGGKRLRPVLLLASCEMCGGLLNEAMPFACALEYIHTYSLIHDDLPAMDDDDLRRGKPTNHKVFGEACAILAGDALLNRAYEIMLGAMKGFKSVPAKKKIAAASIIAEAAGNRGMIGGQIADIESESAEEQGLETLQFIHSHKTAALIRAAVMAGAKLGNTPSKSGTKQLEVFGEQLGLAFQICDDILDVDGDENTLGKPIGSDEKNQKLTYPALLGLEEARAIYGEIHQKAMEALAPFGEKAQVLRGIAEEMYNRVK